PFTAALGVERYSLPLHDALPIYRGPLARGGGAGVLRTRLRAYGRGPDSLGRARGQSALPCHGFAARRHAVHGVRLSHVALPRSRSEEHTSELPSRGHAACRLLPE